jgi:hypothetical protein
VASLAGECRTDEAPPAELTAPTGGPFALPGTTVLEQPLLEEKLISAELPNAGSQPGTGLQEALSEATSRNRFRYCLDSAILCPHRKE